MFQASVNIYCLKKIYKNLEKNVQGIKNSGKHTRKSFRFSWQLSSNITTNKYSFKIYPKILYNHPILKDVSGVG